MARQAWRADRLLLSTVWDTSERAKEFYEAYVSTLAARFPDRKPGEGEEVREGIYVRRVLDRVLVIIDFDNKLDALERSVPSRR